MILSNHFHHHHHHHDPLHYMIIKSKINRKSNKNQPKLINGKPKIKPKLKSKSSPSLSTPSSPWMTISKGRSTIQWGIERWRLWLFVKESAKDRENMREILKQKRKCDFVWMDEMRKSEVRGKLWVFMVWDQWRSQKFIFGGAKQIFFLCIY